MSRRVGAWERVTPGGGAGDPGWARCLVDPGGPPFIVIVGMIFAFGAGYRTRYRRGADHPFDNGTKADNLTAAARTVNAKLASWGYDCDNSLPIVPP